MGKSGCNGRESGERDAKLRNDPKRIQLHLPPDTYQVIDSDPATWANNPESGNAGHVLVWGYVLDEPPPFDPEDVEPEGEGVPPGTGVELNVGGVDIVPGHDIEVECKTADVEVFWGLREFRDATI